ncbi:hypothetical protein DXG01_005426 [Tephrocybe rancida]|nr:hypothetical protein DXG01_005426 [Tephrocybe rancida]
MFYTRGSSSDFDRFANVTGDSGWSWDQVQPYIQKNERWTPPADRHDPNGQFDPSVHGFEGINSVSLTGYPLAIGTRIVQATKELGREFPFNRDMNSGNPIGFGIRVYLPMNKWQSMLTSRLIGWLQSTIKGGERSSSATSYLAPEVLKTRPNLDVLLNTHVTRIMDKHGSFRWVELGRDRTAARRVIAASKEVILSAGTIGTPHILLNSGIGQASALRKLGITPVLDIHDVGKNLQDQPAITSTWFVNSNDTLDSLLDPAVAAKYLEQWKKTETGPLVDSGCSHLGFSRLPDGSSIFETSSDPSSGTNSPHIEFVVTNGGRGDLPGNFIGITNVVVSPMSRGSVSLKSSDPFDYPLIDLGLLTAEFDRFALREAVKSSRRFLTAPVWNDYIVGPAGAIGNAITDEELDEYILRAAEHAAHAVGTAAMSAKASKYGVVDPDLRIKGAEGLRVVDASVMPFVPAGHTQAPTYIIAERASDLIRDAWAQR